MSEVWDRVSLHVDIKLDEVTATLEGDNGTEIIDLGNRVYQGDIDGLKTAIEDFAVTLQMTPTISSLAEFWLSIAGGE